jgi:CHASE2 domain-containing sensor protein
MNNRPLLKIIVFIGIGLMTTVVMLLIKIAFEHIEPGQRLESYAYEKLHTPLPYFASGDDMPVTVIDIGKLEGGTDEHPTSRKNLKEIIDAVVKENPKAIALDIDFSQTEEGGWQDDNDPDFFDYCLEIKEIGTPIFLGVERSAESPAEAWLGLEKYKPLAVGMRFQFPQTSKVILWTKPVGTSEKLPSLSVALAKAYRESLPEPPRFFAPLLEEIEDYDQQTKTEEQIEYADAKAIVNYSMLEAIEAQSLSATTSAPIKENGSRFKNKLVLIGRISNTTDTVRVVGRDKDKPGVLLHAAATYTLVKSPLFEFTSVARVLIDFSLPLLILISIAIIRYRNRNNTRYNWHRKQWIFFVSAVFLVFFGGIFLVRFSGIVWFDFLAVSAALVLHPALEKWITTYISQWFEKNDEPAPAAAAEAE